MFFVRHRCNSIKEIQETSNKYGVEVDIRSYGERLILNHEPFVNGVLFEDWLSYFKHKFLILNVKEEGLENSCLGLLKKFKIVNYFFLDQSFPMLIKSAKNKTLETSMRYSKYESLETVLKFKGLVKWIWVDYYEDYPLFKDIILKLKENQYKICLVSPELQGHSENKINEAFNSIEKYKKHIDAICTKYISKWESLFLLN